MTNKLDISRLYLTGSIKAELDTHITKYTTKF